MLLAIDTATQVLSIALHDGHSLIAEQTLRCGNQHNTLLAPLIQSTLAVCGLSARDLKAVAVAKGPGSYTGLRIGVALAKGLATTGNLPLVGLSTLDILALAAPPHADVPLRVAIGAGRGRIIHAPYTLHAGAWQANGDPAISDWPSLLATLEGATLLTGEINDDGLALIAGRPELRLLPAPVRLRRAAVLAEEAQRLLQAGSAAAYAPARLMPVYLQTAGLP